MKKLLCDLAGDVVNGYLTGGSIGVAGVLVAAAIGGLVAMVAARFGK